MTPTSIIPHHSSQVGRICCPPLHPPRPPQRRLQWHQRRWDAAGFVLHWWGIFWVNARTKLANSQQELPKKVGELRVNWFAKHSFLVVHCVFFWDGWVPLPEGLGGQATSEMMQKVDEGAVGSGSLDLLDGWVYVTIQEDGEMYHFSYDLCRIRFF